MNPSASIHPSSLHPHCIVLLFSSHSLPSHSLPFCPCTSVPRLSHRCSPSSPCVLLSSSAFLASSALALCTHSLSHLLLLSSLPSHLHHISIACPLHLWPSHASHPGLCRATSARVLQILTRTTISCSAPSARLWNTRTCKATF